jgi:hypothetical protein
MPSQAICRLGFIAAIVISVMSFAVRVFAEDEKPSSKSRLFEDFWFGGESAIGPGSPADNFSVRWTGWLIVPTPGPYKLRTTVDEHLRLRLDGKLLFDTAERGRSNQTAVVELTDKPHAIVVEYWDEVGAAGD